MCEARTLRRGDPIALMARLTNHRNIPPSPDDIAAMLDFLCRALQFGGTIDAAAGLAPGWQDWVHERRAKPLLDAALAALDGNNSKRAQAEQLRRAMQRYKASGRYERDLARGFADPGDALSFALLQRHGGKVPSLSTILRRFKTLGDLNHAAGDAGDMIKLRNKPADPAQNNEDERVAARLPDLRREHAEVGRRLREIFLAIGLEVDRSWKPDSGAAEVEELLTGRTAPPEASMPLPALHWRLLCRQDALEKAISKAMRSDARVEERRRDERLAAAQAEIRAAVRKRALLARQLQRANREFLELEMRLGLDPFGGLPSSAHPLLGTGQPGDEVDVVTDGLLACGIISRKDLADAD
jgi:hypothetical protein